jgi:proteic killer suppression protein
MFLAGERVREFKGVADAAAKALTKLQASRPACRSSQPAIERVRGIGDRKGQYSIRINRQFRVCFVWVPHEPIPEGDDTLQLVGDADQVEITDYH